MAKQKHCAFVIGNTEYGGKQNLPNAANDARAIGAELAALGFKVNVHSDLNYTEMKKRFDAFLNYMEVEGDIDTALIYYSGHGFQDDGKNFLLPVPDEATPGEYMSLQQMIDGITPLSKRRVVFLDACRTYLDTEAIADDIQKARSLSVTERPRVQNGIAALEAENDTFIAFSASPGNAAYDGSDDVGLSPFTNAIISFVHEIDLPLSVMMARVRNSVSHATKNLQHTWDSSSLTSAFFFNPSSMLLLIGNAIGILAFVSTLVPFSINLVEWGISNYVPPSTVPEDAHPPKSLLWIMLSIAVMATILTAFLYGLNRAYVRIRGEQSLWQTERTSRVSPSSQIFSNGLIGGLYGGAICAAIFAIPYWYAWRNSPADIVLAAQCADIHWASWKLPMKCPPFGRLYTEIMVVSLFIAGVLGALSLYFSEKVRLKLPKGLTSRRARAKTVWGAVLGGLIAGILTAPIATAYFGQFDRPFYYPQVAIPGAIAAVAIFAFCIVNYSLEKFTIRRLGRSALWALLGAMITVVLLGFVVWILSYTGFIDTIYKWANHGFFLPANRDSFVVRYGYLYLAGLAYGVVFGPFLGFLIGITNALTNEQTPRR